MVSPWPVYDENYVFAADEEKMEHIMTAIRAIRNRRAEMNVPPSKKAKVIIVSSDTDTFCPAVSAFFEKLAGAASVEYSENLS